MADSHKPIPLRNKKEIVAGKVFKISVNGVPKNLFPNGSEILPADWAEKG